MIRFKYGQKNGFEILNISNTNAIAAPYTCNIPMKIRGYHYLGANSFITEPVTFPSLVEMSKGKVKFWFEIVQLPLKDWGERNEGQPNQSFVS